MFYLAFLFCIVTAPDVWRDKAVWRLPQRMIRWQGLGFGYIEISGGNASATQLPDQGILVEGCSAPNVIDNCSLPKIRQPLGVEEIVSILIRRQNADNVIGLRQQLVYSGCLHHPY